MSELDLLKDKVSLLVKKHNELKAQHETLKNELAVQISNIAEKKATIADLEGQLQEKNLAVIATLMSQEEKQAVHTHLDKIIRQIEITIQSL